MFPLPGSFLNSSNATRAFPPVPWAVEQHGKLKKPLRRQRNCRGVQQHSLGI
jgi:hypothetical protein